MIWTLLLGLLSLSVVLFLLGFLHGLNILILLMHLNYQKKILFIMILGRIYIMYHLLAVYVILFVIVGHVLIVQKLFRLIKTYMKMKRVTKISEGKTARSVTPTATDPDVEDFSYNLMKEMLDKFGGDFN